MATCVEASALGGLALIAGSAFLFASYAQEAFPPLAITAMRLSFGSCALLLSNALCGGASALKGLTLAQFGRLALVGTLNTVVPYTTAAAAMGEGAGVGIVAVLMGAGPLFAAVFSACVLPGASARLRGATAGVGLLMGFTGVVLVSLIKEAGRGGAAWRSTELGTGLPVIASASKALASVMGERHNRLSGEACLPFPAQALVQAVSGAVVALALTLAFDCSHSTPRLLDPHGLTRELGCRGFLEAAPLRAWLSMAYLALMGSCASYLLQFFLLRRAGAVRQTLVEYLVPTVGVVLGAIFRHEWAAASPKHVAAFAAGAALTLSGVVLLHRPPAPGASSGCCGAGVRGNPLLSPGSDDGRPLCAA